MAHGGRIGVTIVAMPTSLNAPDDPALERWLALAERLRREPDGPLMSAGGENDSVAHSQRPRASRTEVRILIKKIWVKSKTS